MLLGARRTPLQVLAHSWDSPVGIMAEIGSDRGAQLVVCVVESVGQSAARRAQPLRQHVDRNVGEFSMPR